MMAVPRNLTILLAAWATLVLGPGASRAQDPAATSPASYGFKIYRVESALYPFVQVYMRTFDQNMAPLVNLNELNVGMMIKGRSYDPMKRQYAIQSIRNRGEAIRTIIILDASLSMAGTPFETALKAAARYIDSKRAQDQISILALRDAANGYEVVSGFERDAGALGRRLADIRADGQKTRLYDAVGGAMQMAGTVSQGSTQSGATEHIVSTSIVVFSDGEDDGSALSREELNGRVTALDIPIPIYSVAYANPRHFKNLEALSKNSFGKYYNVGTGYSRMQQVVEDVQHVLQNDYVVTFRSYVEVDGESHPFKLGLEYPSRSGRVTYQSERFEAVQPPPIAALQQRVQQAGEQLPRLPDGDPYMAPQVAAPPPNQ